MVDAINSLHSDTKHHRKRARSKQDRHGKFHHSPTQGLRRMNSGVQWARVLKEVPINPIVEFAKLVRARENGLDFTQGDPAVSLLPEQWAQLKSEVNFQHLSSTSGRYPKGNSGHLEAFVEYLQQEHSAPKNLSKQNIQVFRGGKALIYEFINGLKLTIASEGKKVLVPTPIYPPYKSSLHAHQVDYKNLSTKMIDGFAVDFDNLTEQQLNGIGAIILVNPGNPTGASAPQGFYEKAKKFAAKHPEIVLFFDEAYSGLRPKNTQRSILSQYTEEELPENIVVLQSLSKIGGLPSLRIAYMIAHPKVISAFQRLSESYSGGIHPTIELAASKALQFVPEISSRAREHYTAIANILIKGFQEMGWPQPEYSMEGGMFYYPEIPPSLMGSLTDPSQHASRVFAHFLLNRTNIGTVPGSAFEIDSNDPTKGRHLRISLGLTAQQAEEGIERMKNAGISYHMELPSS